MKARSNWRMMDIRLLCVGLLLMVTACTKVHPKAAVQPSPKDHQLSSATIAKLIAQLDSPEQSIRAEAVLQLHYSSGGVEIPREAVPSLIRLLQDPEFHVRDDAVSVLGEMGEDAKVALPAIMPLLRQEAPLVRRSAVDAIGNMGEPAKAAIPDIIPLLKHQDLGMRSSAVRTLSEIGKSKADVVLPNIVAVLSDREPYVRHAAIMALGNMESSAKAAVPELLKMRSNGDAATKNAVDYTLDRIQGSHPQ
jgi:HEAT repeat protein